MDSGVEVSAMEGLDISSMSWKTALGILINVWKTF